MVADSTVSLTAGWKAKKWSSKTKVAPLPSRHFMYEKMGLFKGVCCSLSLGGRGFRMTIVGEKSWYKRTADFAQRKDFSDGRLGRMTLRIIIPVCKSYCSLAKRPARLVHCISNVNCLNSGGWTENNRTYICTNLLDSWQLFPHTFPTAENLCGRLPHLEWRLTFSTIQGSPG